MAMKDEINLLAPEAVKARMRRLYHREFNRLYWVLLVVAMIVLASYGSVYWVMQLSLTAVQVDIEPVAKEDVDAEKRIQEVNTVIRSINERVSTRGAWMPLVLDVISVMPAELSIASLSVKDSPVSLTVTGRSTSRPSIIAFEHALDALPWIDHVESPLQNFAGSSDASFTFTLFPSLEEEE